MAEVVGQVLGSVMFTPMETAAFPKTRWFFGDGSPADSAGSDGDIYLDRVTGDIYQKEDGTWA